ncbi:MAG TPA: DNRLRE domain-containing protein [Sedimentisphaerales bacterium]|nr:DNRLRE domain-containing protein [Sedimentisphaerales bacterium]
MSIVKFKSLFLRVVLVGGLCMAVTGSVVAAVVTTSFQNGMNGYTGTFERTISERNDHNVNGSDVVNDFLDGYQKDTSPDEQRLIRFDNIIGSDPGQIPAGATILSARLVVTTSLVGNAATAGPYGVAGIIQPFDSTTMYYDYVSATEMVGRGPWWEDGSATRPVGCFGPQDPGVTDSTNVTSVVQSWVDGMENNGLAIQAGLSNQITQVANTTDGWSIRTIGYPFPDTRPKLMVSYTTSPVVKRTFQEGEDGYAGTTMAIVRSGTNALITDTPDEITEDASTLNQTFLDGVLFTDLTGMTSSPDDLALLKFANVFGTEPNQVPMDVPVAKAWVVITTGDTHNSAISAGSYAAYPVLRSWDITSLHSSFGAINGLQVSDGDTGPVLDSLTGFTRGAEAWFDVTSYLEAVRTGATDNGIAIQANGTSDGWQINANGSTTPDARPRLVVYSGDLSL